MAKPSTFPKWAEILTADPTSLENNRVAPSSGKQNTGFTRSEVPPRQDFNYQFWFINQWIEWLSQEVDLNDTHRTGNGSDHANVALNDTHRVSDGKNHSDVVLNNTHRTSDGKNHSDVVLNNTHRGSDGKNHSDVVLNNTFRGIMENSVVITPITMTSDGGISGQASFLRYRYSGRRLELEISFVGTLSGSPTYIDLDLTVIPGIDGSSGFWPQLGICILSIPTLPVSIAGVTQINSGRNFRFITNGTLPVGSVITMDYRTVLHRNLPA
jgi:hypothetical protein